jgi:DNA-binding NtrC family response regulator
MAPIAEQVDVLIVEDDHTLADGIIRAIRNKELTLDFAGDGVEARRMLARKDYKVIVLDLVTPKGHGFDVVDYVRAEKLPSKVIVITGAEPTALAQLDRSIVKTVLFKPLDLEQLASYVHLSTLHGA